MTSKVVRNKVRLYRFYNMNKSDYGSPFALCDTHRKQQIVPNNCVLSKLADKTDMQCDKCAYKEKSHER